MSPVGARFQALYILISFHPIHSSDPQIPTFSWSNGCSVSVSFLGIVLSSCLPQGWLACLRVIRLFSRNGLRFSLSTTTLLSIYFSQQVSGAFCFTILHLTASLLPVSCHRSSSCCHRLLAQVLALSDRDLVESRGRSLLFVES